MLANGRTLASFEDNDELLSLLPYYSDLSIVSADSNEVIHIKQDLSKVSEPNTDKSYQGMISFNGVTSKKYNTSN